jgi:hypothetical protein
VQVEYLNGVIEEELETVASADELNTLIGLLAFQVD